MDAIFRPPPDPWPEQAEGGQAPPWTGRPNGAPLGAVVEYLDLARSDRATVSVAYLDAYPDGLELQIAATGSITYEELRKQGAAGVDVFGRHWPTVDDRADVLPPQLLRVGVRFADGRVATSINGHDRPLGGPILWPLAGGTSSSVPQPGHPARMRCRQGYWVSPLPPPGPVTIVCEWPVAGIPISSVEIDGQRVIDAARQAHAMFPEGSEVSRDGQSWALGGSADVEWINHGTTADRTITSAIPPTFAAYCTLAVPPHEDTDGVLAAHERALLELLDAHTAKQPWWLGYLDTGASDVVFAYAPRTTLYAGWGYVLVRAGPEQAGRWREHGWQLALPDLIFPADRSWLVSTLWDDDWTCIGGPAGIVDAVLAERTLAPRARRVEPGQDATPPGDQAI